jgi:hypothetical protein
MSMSLKSMPLNCAWVLGMGGAGGVIDGVDGPVISQLVILLPRRPVSRARVPCPVFLPSPNTNESLTNLHALGTRRATVYTCEMKQKLCGTRHVVPDPDSSSPCLADARNETLGLGGLENDHRKQHGIPRPRYAGATLAWSTALPDRPPSVVLSQRSPTPIRDIDRSTEATKTRRERAETQPVNCQAKSERFIARDTIG